MTLEAWVNPTATLSGWKDVIYKGNDDYYLMGSGTAGGFPVAGGIFGGTYGEAFAGSALPANTWSHLAATYDGTIIRLYVNGVQVATRAKTGAIAISANPLSIGGDAANSGQHLAGRIDEVRVYSTALTPTQLQTDMSTAVP